MNKLLQNPSHMENQYGTASNDFTVDIKQCFIYFIADRCHFAS